MWGLEIPAIYQVREHEKAQQLLGKAFRKIVLHADELGSKYNNKQTCLLRKYMKEDGYTSFYLT